jgi:hypothetical protein
LTALNNYLASNRTLIKIIDVIKGSDKKHDLHLQAYKGGISFTAPPIVE